MGFFLRNANLSVFVQARMYNEVYVNDLLLVNLEIIVMSGFKLSLSNEL